MPDQFSQLSSYLARPNIPSLDGMRAVAVFLVIGYHFGFESVPGSHGVLIFFVLSGFLITWLLLKEQDRTGSISLAGFYRRRILRIFPAFYAYWLLLVGFLLVAGRDVLWSHAASSFFYLSNYYQAIYGDPNNGFSHTWSLAIEEQFYLLWPFVFLLLRRDLARLTRVLIMIIGTVWIYRVILVFGFGVDQAYLYAAFDTRLDSLMAGCLLAVVLKRGVAVGFWRPLLERSWVPFVTLALFLTSALFGKHLFERYRDVVGFAIEPVLIAVLITQLVAQSERVSWRWLNWGWVRFLGRISYSLYLYQQVTLDPVRKFLKDYPVSLQFIAAVLVTIFVAYLSYALVEQTFQRFRGRRTKAARPSPTDELVDRNTAPVTSPAPAQ